MSSDERALAVAHFGPASGSRGRGPPRIGAPWTGRYLGGPGESGLCEPDGPLRGRAGITADKIQTDLACASLMVRYEVGALDAAAIQDRVHTLLNPAASLAVPPVRPVERAFLSWRDRAGRGMADWKRLVRSLMRSPDCAPPLRPLSVRPEPRKTGAPMLICRLNLRLTRWMLRTSARGWWEELLPERRSIVRARPSR